MTSEKEKRKKELREWIDFHTYLEMALMLGSDWTFKGLHVSSKSFVEKEGISDGLILV